VSHVPPRPDIGSRPRPRRLSRALIIALAVALPVVLVGSVIKRAVPQIRVCSATRRLLATAAAQPSKGGPSTTPSELGSYLPVTTTARSTLYPDISWSSPQEMAEGRSGAGDWVSHLTDDGFRGGIFRQWQADEGWILQAEVLQFPDHAHALAFQDWIVSASCLNARGAFTVEGVSGSVGLRLYWENGDISEQVSFVRGSRRYLAAIRAGVIPPRNDVLSVTSDVAATAA
jgi:hypothetical protein